MPKQFEHWVVQPIEEKPKAESGGDFVIVNSSVKVPIRRWSAEQIAEAMQRSMERAYRRNS